jgi:RND family efflux transporter MFP subunit
MKLKIYSGLMLLTVFTVISCGKEEPVEKAQEVRLAPVEVIQADRIDSYKVEQRFVGSVEARRRSQLAFEIPGTVVSLSRDEGEKVSEGDVLAVLDTSRLEARKAELRATAEQAEATLSLTESTFKRNEKLQSGGGVSMLDLETSQERFQIARGLLNRIEAQLESVEVDLRKSQLRAPYRGTIAKRHLDEGAVVSPNQLVFDLIESDALEVRPAVSGELASRLRPGAEFPLIVNGQTIEALVSRILPQRDSRTQTVDLILSVPESVNDIRDGDLVELVAGGEVHEEGFILPREALTEGIRGLWSCFVAVPDPDAGPEAHRLDRRDLEVVHQYADAVVVQGAIKEGDFILSSGLHKVAPGQRVQIEVVESESIHNGFKTDLAKKS